MSHHDALPAWRPTGSHEPALATTLRHLDAHADELLAAMPQVRIPRTGFHTGVNGSGPFTVAGVLALWRTHPHWHGGDCPACGGTLRTARLLGHTSQGILVGCCLACGATATRTLRDAAHALALVPAIIVAEAMRR